MSIKVLVNCPGSWTHGLDSPERGEGRWSQNIARMLGKRTDHDVFACSAGSPRVGSGDPVKHVTLLSDREAHRHGPFDMYFDAAWYDGKSHVADAKKNFHVHWSLEDRIRTPDFPENHYIIYPYNESKPKFINEANANIDRTFFLPIPLCEKFPDPQFYNKDLLFPMRVIDSGPEHVLKNQETIIDVICEYAESDSSITAHWFFFEDMSKSRYYARIKNSDANHRFYHRMPYNKTREITKKCKLCLPVNLPSCIIDCTADGVATINWEDGGFFPEAAERNGVLVNKGNSQDDIRNVIDTLMHNEEIYSDYVRDLQYTLRHHTEDGSLECFNHIVNSVF